MVFVRFFGGGGKGQRTHFWAGAAASPVPLPRLPRACLYRPGGRCPERLSPRCLPTNSVETLKERAAVRPHTEKLRSCSRFINSRRNFILPWSLVNYLSSWWLKTEVYIHQYDNKTWNTTQVKILRWSLMQVLTSNRFDLLFPMTDKTYERERVSSCHRLTLHASNGYFRQRSVPLVVQQRGLNKHKVRSAISATARLLVLYSVSTACYCKLCTL